MSWDGVGDFLDRWAGGAWEAERVRGLTGSLAPLEFQALRREESFSPSESGLVCVEM